MTHTVLAETTASVSDLKRNPMGTVAAGEGSPVAILIVVVAIGKRNAVYAAAAKR